MYYLSAFAGYPVLEGHSVAMWKTVNDQILKQTLSFHNIKPGATRFVFLHILVDNSDHFRHP